jgi:protein-S-isoprenylcysteine O-methyltransferase Ste14
MSTTSKTAVRGVIGVLTMMACMFGTAGTFAFWQAWVLLGILVALSASAFWYLSRHSPDLLERRGRMHEKEAVQRRVIMLSFIPAVAAFVLPGFDRRWGWSHVPTAVAVAADLIVVLGCVLYVVVLRENRYASRTIETEKGQQVTTTGPYARVRHPMYLAVMIIYVGSPLALGSYWALIPAAFIVPVLVARIRNEEEVLERDLKGYSEYRQHVRYRLLPGIW